MPRWGPPRRGSARAPLASNHCNSLETPQAEAERMSESSPLNVAPTTAAGRQARALMVSLGFAETETTQRIGREAYSYHFVYRAFAPLLQRWGRTIPVT